MKKNSINRGRCKEAREKEGKRTIGMDLGDKTSRYCVLGASGAVVEEGSVATSRKGMTQVFGRMGRCRIAIEVGTHSRG